jgi:hypothetical protein
MATVWLDSDLGALIRLAELIDSVTRDPAQPSLQAQITALEDRLGLTPGARRRLQWEITRADESRRPIDKPDRRKVRAV